MDRVTDLDGHDAYELLGVPSSATDAQIRRAYRQAMFAAHPDRGGPEQLAKLINCAHEVLTDDRPGYDAHRRRLNQAVPLDRTWERHPWEHRPASERTTSERTTSERTTSERTLWEPRPARAYPSRIDDAPPEADERLTDDRLTDERAYPWAQAAHGLGAPPYSKAYSQPDHLEDDRPFRPSATLSPGAPTGWERLINAPVILSLMVVAGLVAGLVTATGHHPDDQLRAGTPVAFPTTYSSSASYPSPPAPSPTSSAYETGISDGPSASAEPSTSVTPGGLVSPDQGGQLVEATSVSHTCAVTRAQRLWCLGSNDEGELGAGDRKDHPEAVTPVGGGQWRAVTTGIQHTCAIKKDRSLWCWGSNAAGQLGIGESTDGSTGGGTRGSTVPVEVAGGHRWLSVAATGVLTCGVRTSHRLYCWGGRDSDWPAGATTPKRHGHLDTWTSVTATSSGLCAARPGHRETCFAFIG